jgi:hypothetical protein
MASNPPPNLAVEPSRSTPPGEISRANPNLSNRNTHLATRVRFSIAERAIAAVERRHERAFCERPMGRAAARRSPQAILDSRSGLDERALQELDGEVRSAGARSTHKLDIVHASPQSWPPRYQ